MSPKVLSWLICSNQNPVKGLDVVLDHYISWGSFNQEHSTLTTPRPAHLFQGTDC